MGGGRLREVVAHGGLTVGINARVTCEPLSPLFSGRYASR